ncbi:bifunctional 4-hydroxy-3-methylbut-2-enyl diphosphate reductase/30S ribosomal protein S1 [Defluviitalea raffinosedens]|uniref:4-hydroxy-3-methylbut-2-enyl diphosphate reductase n=1 Tax=Defluviitalea raffinosedens TaxID=1450156 RepID=A0A7C8LB49_9FIRM|nr:bifunctional 4-hydroxy-3-methylbut-2-enyl diphosphate reductase/30S ribosomal protein S1 [Defluviitalea raffinosedens]KAE9629853.1 bifunctional 4-hydroxy-3-methylbut-2-enyl diphosphate reductase/30S ribosomal protein S1 [Defluviitalea raffinosedens]
MEIIVAHTAGFCFGVNRAVDSVYKNIGQQPLYTYGPIIHNPQVVGELREKNVIPVNSLDEVEEGTIIIRSHGVSKDVYDTINRKGLTYIDSTCPYVKRIHKIVDEYSKKGYQVMIVGDREHPEVQGISGWSNGETIIVEKTEDLEGLNLSKTKPICLVSQTTYREDRFESILKALKDHQYEVEGFNTICKATSDRQQEAVKIAKMVDKMIVIGGRDSSNTKKLYEICKKFCKETYHIETLEDLELNKFNSNDKIGITAGASTPARIIKEVITAMNDLENHGNESFEELLNQSFVTLRSGQIVKGTVIHVTDSEVSVNLGYKSDGIISKSEISNDSSLSPKDVVKLGDEIDVYVLRVNDSEGIVELSKKRVDAQKGWETVKKAYEEGTILTGKVVEVVNGGVIAISHEVRVFIPASLLGSKYNKDLNQLIGKDIEFKVSKIDAKRKRVVGDHKQIYMEEFKKKKEEIFNSLEVGQKVEGTVRNITNFGAFIDLGGIDGLIHISQMSWKKIQHPEEVLKVGQEVEATVLKIDKDKEKISLTLKDEKSNPWFKIEEKYPVGSIVKGKVVRMVPFGAFVELEPGVDGLVHISQIANKHVVKPEDELKLGEVIDVKVLEINKDEKKISLSKKQAEVQQAEVQPEETNVSEE